MSQLFNSPKRLVAHAAPIVCAGIVLCGIRTRASSANQPDEALFELNIEQLMEVDVSSVSRRDEALRTAPAAIHVITSEDIARSGARHIPELLRMVPGMHVARMDAGKWAVTARGFNGRFARHLLVLVDGRSVYSPLFSGTFWEYQDTLIKDIERIEVIRGPGGTMWGANAVNAVINIITKNTADTQGHHAEAGVGTEQRAFGGYRYGGRLNDDAFYRFYVKALEHDSFGAADDWRTQRGGFRLDWRPDSDDSFTLQGDLFNTETGQALQGFPIEHEDATATGANVLARWKRRLSEDSGLSLQMYYDYFDREEFSIAEERHTADIDFQHHVCLSKRNKFIWGLGFRVTSDNLRDSADVPHLDITDEERTDHLYSAFVQDEITLLPDRLELTLGSKLEHNDYSGAELQPSARLSYTPSNRHSFWAAASRAVRTPARLEHNTTLTTEFATGDIVSILSDDSFDSEVLHAYEAGHRARFSDAFSLDTALFYHEYDEFQSVEIVGPTQAPPPLPGNPGNPWIARVGNGLYGETYGVETTARWQVKPWWRLIGSYAFARVQLHVKDNVTDMTSEALFEDDYPRHQANLRSLMDLSSRLQLDAWLRFVDDIATAEDSHIFDEILELDLRLSWRATSALKLELVGRNLLEDRHGEYGSSVIYRTRTTDTPRSFFAQLTWQY